MKQINKSRGRIDDKVFQASACFLDHAPGAAKDAGADAIAFTHFRLLHLPTWKSHWVVLSLQDLPMLEFWLWRLCDFVYKGLQLCGYSSRLRDGLSLDLGIEVDFNLGGSSENNLTKSKNDEKFHCREGNCGQSLSSSRSYKDKCAWFMYFNKFCYEIEKWRWFFMLLSMMRRQFCTLYSWRNF